MDVCVTFLLFIMYIFLLSEGRGQPPDRIYSKLSGNLIDLPYAQLINTDHISSRMLCAMECSQAEMCTLFQFKAGQCQQLKQEAGPGIDIIVLTAGHMFGEYTLVRQLSYLE